ncbi:MAG: Amidase [Bradyrhizobium sp.]|nr:Amidase [Bradyrhizobium sp.]
MRFSEYVTFDAVGLAQLVDSGEVTPSELDATARAAIEVFNGRINAVLETFPEGELAAGGTFRGVPFLVKDGVLSRAGGLLELGSKLAQGFRTPIDSELMKRFRKLGLNTIGRTNMPELGFGTTTEPVANGPTRNPWNTQHMTGGSSGGSAAAVAAGIVPAAHGNDGAGSLRGPSACCGVFSIKPTRGRITLGPGASDGLLGMLAEGVITRTVRDTAALLDGVIGGMPGEPYWIPVPDEPYATAIQRDPPKLRIAVVTETWGGTAISAEVLDAVRKTAELCASLGHDVDFARPELDHESYREANLIIMGAAVGRLVEELAAATNRTPSADNLETATLSIYEYGKSLGAFDLMKVPPIFNKVSRSFGAFFEEWDILLTPTTATPPAVLGTYNQNAEGQTAQQFWDWKGAFVPFLAHFNVTGQPAMTVPLYQSADGLPIGIQAAANHGREHVLLQLAAQLERALPWEKRRPAMTSDYASNQV